MTTKVTIKNEAGSHEILIRHGNTKDGEFVPTKGAVVLKPGEEQSITIWDSGCFLVEER